MSPLVSLGAEGWGTNKQYFMVLTIVVHYQDLAWRGDNDHPWIGGLKEHCEGLVWLESNFVVNN